MGILKKILLSLLSCLTSVTLALAWGVWGHEHINHAAVFALPSEMRLFFYDHIDFITEESSVPDLRKYVLHDKAEFARHYIDLESYDQDNQFEKIPKTWQAAKAEYDSAFLENNGILPWYIQTMMTTLTEAFRQKNKTEILFLAADLGHYLGDANMPLHTALNHNGQFTNQKGIHAFWESQLPELFGDSYHLRVGPPEFIGDITGETWKIIAHSHQLADTLLLADSRLRDSFPPGKIYKTDAKGRILKNEYGDPVHSYAYALAYHRALNGMVEKQLRHAIQDVANFWYTAWVNAGKPDLDSLDPPELIRAHHNQYLYEYHLYLTGKLAGFIPTPEFNR